MHNTPKEIKLPKGHMAMYHRMCMLAHKMPRSYLRELDQDTCPINRNSSEIWPRSLR